MVVTKVTQPRITGWLSSTRLMTRNLDYPGGGLVILMTCLLLTGCTEQPVTQLDAAIHALEDARMSGAEDYAIEIFTEAETAYLQATKELDQQRDRMQIFRDYQSATTMLAKVLTSAEQAKIEAITNKEETKENAEAALAFARKNPPTVRPTRRSGPGPAIKPRKRFSRAPCSGSPGCRRVPRHGRGRSCPRQ